MLISVPTSNVVVIRLLTVSVDALPFFENIVEADSVLATVAPLTYSVEAVSVLAVSDGRATVEAVNVETVSDVPVMVLPIMVEAERLVAIRLVADRLSRVSAGNDTVDAVRLDTVCCDTCRFVMYPFNELMFNVLMFVVESVSICPVTLLTNWPFKLEKKVDFAVRLLTVALLTVRLLKKSVENAAPFA